MNWTEPKSPTANESSYDHITCQTPLGKCIIEWKSWKDNPSYDISLEDECIYCEYNLENAKQKALEHLVAKKRELDLFLDL